MHVWLDVSFIEQIIRKSCDSSCLSSALILLILGGSLSLAVIPVQNRGVALDLEALGELLLDSGINFSELDLALHLSGSFVPLWLEGFAVSAPGGIELNHPDVF